MQGRCKASIGYQFDWKIKFSVCIYICIQNEEESSVSPYSKYKKEPKNDRLNKYDLVMQGRYMDSMEMTSIINNISDILLQNDQRT